MRIVFMGTPDFAVASLQAVVRAGHEVLAVVAQPDRRKGRGGKVVSPPTVIEARRMGLTVKQPRAIKRGPFPDWMAQCGADIAVVVAYGRILTPHLLSAPRLGCINVHGSLLPRYRGAAPIQWSIINGDAQTGVCTMQMDAGLDTGDVLMRQAVPIGPNETAGELFSRLCDQGATLLIKTLDNLAEITPQPQDHDQATHAPPLTKAHGEIDWTQTGSQIHNRVRGVHPWPCAYSQLRGERIKIWRTCPGIGEGRPGEVINTKGALVVAAGQNSSVELLEVQRPGKRAQPGEEFARGMRISVGEMFVCPS